METDLLQKYAALLEVAPGASIPEIRQAYRRKAVQYHPDKNPSPDAHEQFVLLTEAYQYMVARKSGKLAHPRKKVTQDEFWEQYAREEARKKARHAAGMHFEKFRQSKEYPNPNFDFIGHLSFLFYFLLLLSMPFGLYFVLGRDGLMAAGALLLLTSPFTYSHLRYMPRWDLKRFLRRTKEIMMSRYFGAGVLFVVNMIIFFWIDLRTLITLSALLGLFGIGATVAFAWGEWKGKRTPARRLFRLVCVGPALVHIALLLNFLISFHPVQETYEYYQLPGRRRQPSPVIRLENGRYDSYPGIRTDLFWSSFDGGSQVTYTFRTGLFGIRVMSSYEVW